MIGIPRSLGGDAPLTSQDRSIDLAGLRRTARRVHDGLGSCVSRGETGPSLDLTDHLPTVLPDLAKDHIHRFRSGAHPSMLPLIERPGSNVKRRRSDTYGRGVTASRMVPRANRSRPGESKATSAKPDST